MYLGFLPSHSLVSTTLACAEFMEAPWRWVGQLKRKDPLERGPEGNHPSSGVGGPSTFVFCVAELVPGAQCLVQSQPQ